VPVIIAGVRGFAVIASVLIGGIFVAAASATELTINPGVGIGKVKLGMTKAQVERVLGPGPLVNAREGPYTEFAWEFATWTVGFQRGRAVQVSTTLAGQRTKNGIGPGRSTWLALMRAYPGGRCTWAGRFDSNGNPWAYWLEYLVGRKGGSQTVYRFRSVEHSAPILMEVTVRTTFRPLPEFASNWPYRCAEDWQHAEIPRMRTTGQGG
jgi:hypothetical protein